MNRRKLPGVASATKRLADGTPRRYYYAWRGGPLLKGEDGTPLQPGDPAFHVAYTAAHAARRKPAAGTLFSLIAAFKTSSEFTGIRSEKTKRDYRRYLKMIEDELAPFTSNGFGNWFRDQCNDAGLSQCSAHGLRKARASILAERGATDRQLMAVFGWESERRQSTRRPPTVSDWRRRPCALKIRMRT
jgi:hypothetical protein